jgi:hypothetical protein
VKAFEYTLREFSLQGGEENDEELHSTILFNYCHFTEDIFDLDRIGGVPYLWAILVEKTYRSCHKSQWLDCYLQLVPFVTCSVYKVTFTSVHVYDQIEHDRK